MRAGAPARCSTPSRIGWRRIASSSCSTTSSRWWRARAVVADLLGRCPGTDVVVSSRCPQAARRIRVSVEPAPEPTGRALRMPGRGGSSSSTALRCAPSWTPTYGEVPGRGDLPEARRPAARDRTRRCAAARPRHGVAARSSRGPPRPRRRQRSRTCPTVSARLPRRSTGATSCSMKPTEPFPRVSRSSSAAGGRSGGSRLLRGPRRRARRASSGSSNTASSCHDRGPPARGCECWRRSREYARRAEGERRGGRVRSRHAAYFDDFVASCRPALRRPRAPRRCSARRGLGQHRRHDPWRLAAHRTTRPSSSPRSSTWRYIWLYDRVREAQRGWRPCTTARTSWSRCSR